MPKIGVPKNYEFGEEPFANPGSIASKIQIADDMEVRPSLIPLLHFPIGFHFLTHFCSSLSACSTLVM
jgi:hypothetical protein